MQSRSEMQAQRSDWLYQQRAFPLGEIPAHGRARALEQIKKSKEKRRQLLSAQALAVEADERWINIGPAPISTARPGLFLSGRVAAIAVDPLDTNHWLLGAAQGGIWETHNAGAHWTPLTDDQPSLAMGAITFASGNPSIIYAGTGEAAFSGDSYAGGGILKSLDGGQTWHILGADVFARASFSEIRVDPANANRLVVATAYGRGGRSGYILPSPPTGFLTSDDGGTNWTVRFPGSASDVEVDPRDFARQYGALGGPRGTLTNGIIQTTNGVYRSLNAGQTWSRVAGPWDSLSNRIGRIEMALAPSNPNVLNVSVALGFVYQGYVGTGGSLVGIWRTTNAWGATPVWFALPTPTTGDPSEPPQLWYDHQLSVHPTNANSLYLGEFALQRYDGTSWTVIAGFDEPYIHEDQQAIVWAGSRLIVGNDGGVWSSIDDGVTWTNHNTDLAITQFYLGSLHPSNPNFALAGSQDTGTQKWTGSNSWRGQFGGDGCKNAISSRNPDTQWAVSAQNSFIFEALDGGTSGFYEADNGIDPANGLFVTRFAKHPSIDTLFIHGTDRLWKCTNFFTTNVLWFSNSPALLYPVTSNIPFDVHTNMLPDRISSMQFAPSDGTGNIYAYGTEWGTLRLTTNGGLTWSNLDPANAVPNRFISEMVFEPNNANVLWLTLSGWYGEDASQLGHVFKTTNALAAMPSWMQVTPPVNIPHNTVAIDPHDPNVVYVGTDIGVWKTTDGGGSWAHMGPETGLPNVAVFDIQINEPTERVVAFTHGRGAFVLVNTNSASLRLAQAASPDPVTPGCQLTYSLTVRNLGVRTATGVLLTNLLPAGVSFISATPSQGACAQVSGVVNCNLGTLPSFSNATVRIVVVPLAAGLALTNSAVASANEPEASPWNNSSVLVTSLGIGQIHPGALTVRSGSNVTFSVAATNCLQSTFQWRLNGNVLPGATNTVLTLINVGAPQLGDYIFSVSNVAGIFTTAPATLTILLKPAITLQPTPAIQTVVAGDLVSITVGASGTLPMSYGWRLDGSIKTNIILNSNFCTLRYVAVATSNILSTNAWRVGITNLIGLAPGLTSTGLVIVLPDSDGDHIPDYWELAYGLNPTNAADALLDSDRDGFSNLAEYIAGTDPQDPQSYLKIERLHVGSDNTRLEFLAVSNRTYSVLFREDPGVGSWAKLADVSDRPTNRLEVVIDPAPAPGQRFYRLVTPRRAE
jgi:uncharacterized repeat protein (TIGR01451 family)